ncbi:hypothetical protein [Mycobacterium sp.]
MQGTGLFSPKPSGLAPNLTLLRGISFEQENIRWGEQALTIVGRRVPVGP